MFFKKVILISCEGTMTTIQPMSECFMASEFQNMCGFESTFCAPEIIFIFVIEFNELWATGFLVSGTCLYFSFFKLTGNLGRTSFYIIENVAFQLSWDI